MRDYGKIYQNLWSSQKFGKLKTFERMLYLYFHTCSSVNSIGCFVSKPGYALADLGPEWTQEIYDSAIDALCEVGLIGYDPDENLVRIVDYLKFDPFTK